MKNNSWVFVTTLSAVTFLLTMISVESNYNKDNFDVVLSLASGAISMVLMAASCILAIRLSVFEKIFGGLDRVYEQHKWLGIWAIILITYHLLVKASIKQVGFDPLISMPKPWPNLLQGLSLIGLAAIIITSLNRSIRYSLWRWIHKLSGFIFLLAVAHWLTVKTIVPMTSPAGIWMSVVCLLGAVAFLYRLVVYDWLHHGKTYLVTGIDNFRAV